MVLLQLSFSAPARCSVIIGVWFAFGVPKETEDTPAFFVLNFLE
jgi:hypothetical protein